MTQQLDMAQRAAEHLAALIRIPTITPESAEEHDDATAAAFALMRSTLEEFYPRTFSVAEAIDLGRAGVMLKITGATNARPVVLMAHQDVVPVPHDWQAEGWQHPPFDGVIEAGWVHGRGALDDKGDLVVMLEAVEDLLASEWRPRRDLYLLLGADEESYGNCAKQAASWFGERGIVPYVVLDEGGAVATGAFPGVSRPMAVVGVSEKGIVSLELRATSSGGHASTPPRTSAAGHLARAVTALETHPFPARVHDVQVEMFRTLAPHAKGALGLALRFARPLRAVLAQVLPRLSPELASLVRTSTAVTKLAGSPAHNVLATSATASVNMRVAVGWTVERAVARVRGVVGDDIEVSVFESSEPSRVSPTGDDARWLAMREAIAESYPEAVTVPYIMMAATDSRHLAPLCEAVYRFAPLRMDASQRLAVHGPNERVEIESLGRGVRFYTAVLTGRVMET